MCLNKFNSISLIYIVRHLIKLISTLFIKNNEYLDATCFSNLEIPGRVLFGVPQWKLLDKCICMLYSIYLFHFVRL